MLTEILITMIRCLLETIILECGIAYLLGYRKKDMLFILLVNVLTNPIVVSVNIYFQMHYGINGHEISLLLLELFAFLSEAIIYKFALENKKINVFTLSLILNASSFGIGELINMILRLLG